MEKSTFSVLDASFKQTLEPLTNIEIFVALQNFMIEPSFIILDKYKK